MSDDDTFFPLLLGAPVTADEQADLLPEPPPRGHCPACADQRLHTPEEWEYHPFADPGNDHGNGR